MEREWLSPGLRRLRGGKSFLHRIAGLCIRLASFDALKSVDTGLELLVGLSNTIARAFVGRTYISPFSKACLSGDFTIPSTLRDLRERCSHCCVCNC